MTHNVTIVRPEPTLGEVVRNVIETLAEIFIQSALIMLLLPSTVFGISPGYMEVVTSFVVIRAVLNTNSHRLWTRGA